MKKIKHILWKSLIIVAMVSMTTGFCKNSAQAADKVENLPKGKVVVAHIM